MSDFSEKSDISCDYGFATNSSVSMASSLAFNIPAISGAGKPKSVILISVVAMPLSVSPSSLAYTSKVTDLVVSRTVISPVILNVSSCPAVYVPGKPSSLVGTKVTVGNLDDSNQRWRMALSR